MSLDVDELIHDIELAYERLSSSEHASVPLRNPNPSKATTKAKEFRDVGNWHFKKKRLEDALSSYTKSIAYALDGSEELGKAYGNRSAVLFRLERYTSCLLDINRALKSIPDLLRQKLVDRKERCLALMKSSADGCGDTDDEIDEDATNPPTDRGPSWRTDVFSQFGNPFIPNASPKIRLKYDEKWGGHYIANVDIKPGETLFIEDYFATAVFSDDDGRYKYCDFCISTCDSLIPCLSCAEVMFCSVECRQKAYDSYHRLECKLSFNFAYESVFVALAIRIFLIGTQQGASLENLMNTLSIADILAEMKFDFSGKPVDSDYLTILRLTHGTFKQSHLKLLVEKVFEFVVVLQKYEFFESVPVDRLKEAVIFTVQLLLNNYSDRFMNGLHNAGGKSQETLKKGAGICPLQYIFNHSCCPNVGTCRRKREIIVYATRPIKKDEQLFVTYYNEFLSTSKAERAKYLNFKCTCEACLNNWPTTAELRSSAFMTTTNIEDCLEYSDAREAGRVLSSVIHVVVPLLDDNWLLNLQVEEIIRILGDMISLCCQVMGPLSFPLVDSRYYLLTFIGYYYEEKERDPTQDRNLIFPIGNIRAVDDVWRIIFIGRTGPTDMFFTQAMKTIFDALLRLKTYIRQSRFIRNK